jgi:multidrug efflux pump subunit AcrA (membrane-fusion protein)
MELSQSYSALQADYESLKAAKETLEAAQANWETDKANLELQINDLTAFKKAIERKEKEVMINETFYMLSDEDKKDVLDNIDTYSLDDIEAKLSIICVRNKISFGQEEEPTPSGTTTYNLHEVSTGDDSMPAWIKAVLDKQKTM